MLLQVRYCGRSCQEADWETHQHFCQTLRSQEIQQAFQVGLVGHLDQRPDLWMLGSLSGSSHWTGMLWTRHFAATYDCCSLPASESQPRHRLLMHTTY